MHCQTKQTITLFCLFALTALPHILVAKKTSDETYNRPRYHQWVVIGYFDSNNDLDYAHLGESWVIDEFHQLEKVGSSDSVLVIGLLASMKDGGIARIYRVEKQDSVAGDRIHSPVLTDLGTRDLSRPKTLRDLIDYAVDEYPAENYMLILTDHGSGWRGVCWDYRSAAREPITMPALSEALVMPDSIPLIAEIVSKSYNKRTNEYQEEVVGDSVIWNTKKKLDVVFFAACLMGQVEVAYQIRDLADYMVASEDVMWPRTTIVPTWLEYLTQNPNTPPDTLSFKVVDAVYNAADSANRPVTIAAIDLSQMEELGKAIKRLTDDLRTIDPAKAQGFLDAQNMAYREKAYWDGEEYLVDDTSFVDLNDFFVQIKQNQTILLSEYTKNLIEDIFDMLEYVVPYYKYKHAFSRCGMSIYFPYRWAVYKDEEEKYTRLKFEEIGWSTLIRQTLIRQAD